MKHEFSTVWVGRVALPEHGAIDHEDAKMVGLQLRVSASGRKVWRVNFRTPFGKKRTVTLGRFPLIGLADARAKAKEILARNALDRADPVAAAAREAALAKERQRASDTFGSLAALFMEKWSKPRKRSWAKDQQVLDKHVLPKWGRLRADEIRRRDARALLEAIAEHAPTQANRTASLLSKIFNFAIDRELIESNPAYRMLTIGGPERVRDRVLTPDELRAVWRSLDHEPARERAIFRLLILTAQRKAEVAEMPWAEVDLDTGWWELPAARSKNNRPNRTPLVGEALAILRTQRDDALLGGAQVFRAARDGRPTATLQKILDRVKARTGVEFRIHDLRRTAASEMASSGIDPVTIGRLLNHVQRGITEKHYLRYSFDAEKRGALLRWDARVREIVTGERAAKVVSIDGTPVSG